jgi:hypothetical protein
VTRTPNRLRHAFAAGAAAVSLPVLGITLVVGPSWGMPNEQPGCAFDRGVTTCVSMSTSAVTSNIVQVSGCMAFVPPASFVPGRRERTYLETFAVTTSNTTLSHGRNGAVFAASSSSTRELVSMQLVSDTCVALG